MAEKKKADGAKAKPKGEVRKKKKDPIADADTADVGSTAKEFAKSAIDVVNTSNEKVSNIVLHPDVFRARVNKHLLYEAVKQYRAGGRARHAHDQEPRPGQRLGQEALAAEGHGTRPRRRDPHAPLASRRHGVRAPRPATTPTTCRRRRARPRCARP